MKILIYALFITLTLSGCGGSNSSENTAATTSAAKNFAGSWVYTDSTTRTELYLLTDDNIHYTGTFNFNDYDPTHLQYISRLTSLHLGTYVVGIFDPSSKTNPGLLISAAPSSNGNYGGVDMYTNIKLITYFDMNTIQISSPTTSATNSAIQQTDYNKINFWVGFSGYDPASLSMVPNTPRFDYKIFGTSGQLVRWTP